MSESRGKPKGKLIAPGLLGATVLVVALFAFWGMSNSLNDVLIPQFRKTFQLGDFASSFVQFATFIGYFVFAIPAALFMRRFGYRAAVVMGLVLFGTGALLFYPAAQFGEYHFFLGALFVVASGLSFLETSANPMIAAMGPPESADQRLNFAQTFNPLGTIVGVFIGKELILSDPHLDAEQIRAMEPAAQAAWRAGELAAVKLPYLGIACLVLLWALLVAIAKFPPLAQRVAADADAGAGGFRGLLAFPRYWLGVLAQFAYVGAQVGVWSFVIRYTQFNTPGTAEKVAANNLIITLTLFFAGRFIGTLLMSKFRPAAAAGDIRGGRCRVVQHGGARGRQSRPVRAHGDQLLHVDPVPDHLHHEPARPRHAHQVRFVVPRHGHRGRRGDSAGHGAGVGREQHQHWRCSCRRCASPWCSCSAGLRVATKRRRPRWRTPHERGARASRAGQNGPRSQRARLRRRGHRQSVSRAAAKTTRSTRCALRSPLACATSTPRRFYGFGLSELRLGAALAGVQPPPVISTKVGRRLVPTGPQDASIGREGYFSPRPFAPVFDYGYDAVMRSHAESLERLEVQRVDILLCHDIGRLTHGDSARGAHAPSSSMAAIARCANCATRARCAPSASASTNRRCASSCSSKCALDCILLAGRYTLLEQPALEEAAAAVRAAARVHHLRWPIQLGNPRRRLDGPARGRTTTTRHRPPAVLERVRQLEAVCAEHGVPLQAAALQFPLAHPAVATVVAGCVNDAEAGNICENVQPPDPRRLLARAARARSGRSARAPARAMNAASTATSTSGAWSAATTAG